jgi:hypothetical protein
MGRQGVWDRGGAAAAALWARHCAWRRGPARQGGAAGEPRARARARAAAAAAHGPPRAPRAPLPAQGPSDEARRQVQSGRVVTPAYGEILLDPEPDQKLVRGGGRETASGRPRGRDSGGTREQLSARAARSYHP